MDSVDLCVFLNNGILAVMWKRIHKKKKQYKEREQMVEIKCRTISEPKETTRHVFRKRSDDKSRA